MTDGSLPAGSNAAGIQCPNCDRQLFREDNGQPWTRDVAGRHLAVVGSVATGTVAIVTAILGSWIPPWVVGSLPATIAVISGAILLQLVIVVPIYRHHARHKCGTCGALWAMSGRDIHGLLSLRGNRVKELYLSGALAEAALQLEGSLRAHAFYRPGQDRGWRALATLLAGGLHCLHQDYAKALPHLRAALPLSDEPVLGSLIARAVAFAETRSVKGEISWDAICQGIVQSVASGPLNFAGIGRDPNISTALAASEKAGLIAAGPTSGQSHTVVADCADGRSSGCPHCGNELLACHTHRCTWCEKCARRFRDEGRVRVLYIHPRHPGCEIISTGVADLARVRDYAVILAPLDAAHATSGGPQVPAPAGAREPTPTGTPSGEKARCLVCAGPAVNPVSCPLCETVTCVACWNYSGGCPIYGCQARKRN